MVLLEEQSFSGHGRVHWKFFIITKWRTKNRQKSSIREPLAENYEGPMILDNYNVVYLLLIIFGQGLFDRGFLPIFGSPFCNKKFPMDATMAGKRLKTPPTTQL